jgi:hypothetical protein
MISASFAVVMTPLTVEPAAMGERGGWHFNQDGGGADHQIDFHSVAS